MTFLELCQRLRQEAGISGNGPASVLNPTGIEKKIVDWVRRAYYEIQNVHKDWNFLWTEGQFTTTAGKRDYNPRVELGLTNFGVWDVHAFFARRNGSQKWPLIHMEYEPFRQFYLYDQTGEPIHFTILPNDNIRFDVTPSEAETIDYVFYRAPFELVNNADLPAFGKHFHQLIVYKALMYYAADEEAGAIYQDAAANYRAWLTLLENAEYTPPHIMMSPLA